MTAQINDAFHFDGTDYSVAGISEGELFHPPSLGLEPRPASTACWRGYQAVFGLRDDFLILKTLHARLAGDTKAHSRKCLPEINGVAPTHAEGFFFDSHYTDINYQLNYSGGLLIAHGFIEALYVHMGFHPAWKYECVRELVFDRGRPVSNTDRSAQMAEVRQRLLATFDPSDPTGMSSSESIRSFIDRAFDRSYEL